MTREEAIHKMEYSKRAYQMLIDEKVQEGVLVGKGINAEWSADTPIIDAYKDMLEACDMAIKALEQEPMWIPVTKRQPKKSGKYWCTFGGTNLTGTDYYTTESDAKETYEEPEEYIGWQSQNVIAWMPLPSSYREQEELIKQLPQERSEDETPNEPKWIPVSERLPEKSDRYLAYIVNRKDDKLQYIMTCDYLVDGYWNWFPDAESASDNVIAWMPLPAPFEPQRK